MERRSESMKSELRFEIERHYGVEPDAVYILGGGVRKLPQTQRYMSASFTGDGSLHNNGAFFRMYAVSELAKLFSNMKIVTSGYSSQAGFPSSAEVMETELLSQGIKRERITKLTEPTSTGVEILEAMKLAVDIAKVKHSGALWICTNEFHIPRSRDMLRLLQSGNVHFLPLNSDESERLQEEVNDLSNSIADNNVTIKFVAAEHVLGILHPTFKTAFKKFKSSDSYEYLILSELSGKTDLQNGTYRQKNGIYKQKVT